MVFTLTQNIPAISVALNPFSRKYSDCSRVISNFGLPFRPVLSVRAWVQKKYRNRYQLLIAYEPLRANASELNLPTVQPSRAANKSSQSCILHSQRN